MSKIIKIVISIVSLLLFLIVGIYLYQTNDKNYSRKSILESQYITDEDIFDINIDNNYEKVELIFDNYYSSDKKDIVHVEFYDDEDKKIYDKKISATEIRQNKYQFKITNTNILKKVKIINKTKDNSIKIKKMSLLQYQNNNKKYFTIFLSIITISSIILLIIFQSKNIKIENCYLVSAIFIYAFFLLAFPLFTTHDELYHWFRAYEVSEGRLLSEVNENKALSHLPSSVSQINNEELHSINYRSVKKNLEIKSDSSETLYDMRTVAVYSPIQYLPQSIGIFLARKITDRTLLMAYSGRVFNALFAIAMIFFAIKIIPFGKRIIYTIAFLPITIEGFTSLSADAITISTALLFISYILMLIYDKKTTTIRKRDILILFILCTIIAFCKIVYIPLILLCFLVPKNKYKSKKIYYISNIFITLTCILFNLGWLKIASGYLALSATTNVQTSSLFAHPIRYLQVVLYTLFNNFQKYLFTMIGNELGWEEFVRPLTIIPVSFLFLLIINSLFDRDSNNKLHLKENTMFCLVSLSVIGLIFTSLYVQFTKPGSVEISGIQGRYFIPILPLLLFLISNFKTLFSKKVNFDKLTTSMCLILNYSVLITLFIQFL